MKYSMLLLAAFAAALLYLTGADPGLAETFAIGSVAAFGAGDLLLTSSKALPAGASAIVTDAIDLGHGDYGSNVADHEFQVTIPELSITELANTQTMIYDILTSDAADLSSPTVVHAAYHTQTGATGEVAAAAVKNFRLPTDCQRYVGIRATKSGSGSAATQSVTLALKF